MGKGVRDLTPLEYQIAKFNLAPNESKPRLKCILDYPFTLQIGVNGKVNRVNHPSKGI